MIKKTLLSALSMLIIYTISAQEFVKMMQEESRNFYEIQSAFESFYEGKPYEKGKGYKQFKRWEWFMEQRVHPTGERFSSTAAWNNFMSYKKEHQAAFTAEKSAGWVALGLNDFINLSYSPGQGRVNVIAVDPFNPNIIYVGVPAGGLWKSIDGGNTWNVLTDHLPVLGVSGIGIDPNNSNIIYIATGDGDGSDTYSIGVLKSTDGGSTFAPTGMVHTISQSIRPTKILMHPTNSKKHWVSSSNGLFITEDAGASYTRVQTGFIRDIEMHPTDTNIIYACSNEFFKSTNGGFNFTKITMGLPSAAAVNRMSIAVSIDNPSLVYGLYGDASDASYYGLYRSSDLGTSFTQMSNSPNILSSSNDGMGSGGQSWYDLALAVSPDNANEVFVGGVNVWKSLDSGRTFNIIAHWALPNNIGYTHADIHTLDFYNGKLYCGSDGGIYESIDKGATWVDKSRTLEISQFYRLGGSEIDPTKIVGGTQDNGCFRGSTLSKTWTHVFGADGMECAIHPTNSNILFTSSQNGGLRRSTDNGNSFTGIAGTIRNSESGAWLTPYALDPNNSDRIVAGFENIWLSNNLGSNWTKISNFPGGPTFRSIAIAKSNSNVIYAGTQNSIFRTTNLGSNWTDVTGNLSNQSKTYIEVDHQNTNNVWVTVSGFNASEKVYYSNSGGSNWSNITYNLPNLPVNCIERDERNGVLYVGTDVGVYYLKPYTTEWLPYMTGLPNVIVNELEMNYATNKLRAATYGRGIWESDPFQYPTNQPVSRFNSTKRINCPNVVVQFNDQSVNTVTSYQWQFPGGTPSTSTAANPTVTYANTGSYDVTLIVSDGTNSDTSKAINYIEIQTPNLEQSPFSEDFELVTFPRNPSPKFTIINEDGDNSWEHGFNIPALTYTLSINNFTTTSAGKKDILEFPAINLDTISYPVLFLDRAYSSRTMTDSDTLNFYYSIDCGNTKVKFASFYGAALRTVTPTQSEYSPGSSSDFQTLYAHIYGAENQPIVNLYLENVSGFGNKLFIDNILVKAVISDISEINSTGQSFSVYPNPTTAEIQINWKDYSETPTIEIFDYQGKLVKTIKSNKLTGNVQYNFDGLSKGLYLVKLSTSTSEKTSRVILK
ncbi:VPS10 domain-containing protein [Acidiluteibacter ferrifornacis]|uniref:T9SS type A sorting domain-containing protein n=1 Tax=Acidiluteibacter ferrifornacis TaxID=2692424 RepID=A0A6N9NJ65_9FLAO|nr:T9SS type A sorting domain-containing protein [Acidiluteibacter ferrifornacis]NBG65902.1 T9SS type A sorting domain-containing protein [Acidiluteibacter ferrifornacis]